MPTLSWHDTLEVKRRRFATGPSAIPMTLSISDLLAAVHRFLLVVLWVTLRSIATAADGVIPVAPPLVNPPTSPPVVVVRPGESIDPTVVRPRPDPVPRVVYNREDLDRIVAADRTPPGTRLANVSVRSRVRVGEPQRAGFVITGTSERTVLIRISGTGLRAFGVSETLSLLVLRVFDARGGVWVETSTSASTASRHAESLTGAFPPGLFYTAVVMTLPAGAYTIEAFDLTVGGYPHVFDAMPPPRPGVVIVEIFDLAGGADARLGNVSRLGLHFEGEDRAIVGFVVTGEATRSFLVRGVGPGLAGLFTGATVADPALFIYDSVSRVIASNDNWNIETVGLSSARAGAFPLLPGSRDAAMVLALGPGAYTVHVSAPAEASGSALMEVYELP